MELARCPIITLNTVASTLIKAPMKGKLASGK
jgi:hypothetical protein